MPLPSLPPPSVCRDQYASVSWLELALTSCLEVYRDILKFEVTITPQAEELLCGLQEWLHYAVRTERARRRNRRFAEACQRRTWFLYQKYETVRSLLVYDAARQAVSLQAEPVPETPSSTSI